MSKKVHTVSIDAYDRIQPTNEEILAAMDELMRRKIAESTGGRGKPSFKVEVATDSIKQR